MSPVNIKKNILKSKGFAFRSTNCEITVKFIGKSICEGFVKRGEIVLSNWGADPNLFNWKMYLCASSNVIWSNMHFRFVPRFKKFDLVSLWRCPDNRCTRTYGVEIPERRTWGKSKAPFTCKDTANKERYCKGPRLEFQWKKSQCLLFVVWKARGKQT